MRDSGGAARGNPPAFEAEESARGGSLARFFILCFFGAAVLAVLGLYLINLLFDETRQFSPPTQDELRQAAIGNAKALKPPPARNQLRVYFTNDGVGLVQALAPLGRSSASPHERGRLALEALFDGPGSEAMQSPVPPGVRLRGFYLRQGEEHERIEAVIDLNRNVKRKPLGAMGAELLCVQAIVNTALANCETAACALILVEGQPADTLWGHIDISGPLTQSATLVREPK